jgi:hypothetical protein
MTPPVSLLLAVALLAVTPGSPATAPAAKPVAGPPPATKAPAARPLDPVTTLRQGEARLRTALAAGQSGARLGPLVAEYVDYQELARRSLGKHWASQTPADRAALVAALASGLIDTVVSDHDPQDVETKRLPFAEAAPGAIGIETMLAASLRLVHSGDIALPVLLKAMSTRPAELLGLPGGTLRPGSPADVVVFDPEAPWVLDRATLKSKCKNTPFDEARLQGRVTRTIVAGRTVYEYV